MKATDNYSNTDLSLEITYNLMFTNHGEIPYIELSTFGNEKNFVLPGHFNQEDEYLKMESFEKLSKEAKDVIDIVLNSPAEILEKFKTSKYNLYSKELLKGYLKEKFNWKKPKMDRVFVELASYTNQL